MWHVETDFFALAVFLIMFIKEFGMRRKRKKEQIKGEFERDIRSDSFYFVLVFSIISALIDATSSIAMNSVKNWWLYEILMTIYVASMPLLAAVWVCYAYVLIHEESPLNNIIKRIFILMVPYFIYILVALSNPFTGLFFKLSKEMEYERGILFMPVGVGFIMLYSGIGFLLVLFCWKKITPGFNVLLLLAFFCITAVFTWVQLAHPGWLIINASYAVVYIWCDITIEERRRQQLYEQLRDKNEELKIAAKKAETAAKAKTEFLSRMSHDIRTPMNAIIGLNHLSKTENDINVLRDYQNKIESSSKFLLGLINDILDLSKIESGEMELHEEPFTKDAFRTSIQTVVKPLIDEKEINFNFQMNCNVECIKVDKLRYCQIFFNLLSNAAKFTPKGGTIEFVSERIESSKKRTDGKVGLRIFIRDNGIGMSEEFQKQMYNPFIQDESEIGNKIRGTGLGLPIVKSLVDAMGGTIEVKSSIGTGTEFKIELFVEPANVPDVKEAQQCNQDTLKGVRLLLVEDNDLNIYVAKTILERFSCSVYVAKNGKEAVDKFAASEENFYNVILMDVHMPVMNGLEATKVIRAMTRKDASDVLIIAMTADAFDKEKKVILESGMNCHLSKPIEPVLLCQTIVKYMEKNNI